MTSIETRLWLAIAAVALLFATFAIPPSATGALVLQATSAPLAWGGLTQWQVSAVGTAGEFISGFGRISVSNLSGTIHQVWTPIPNTGPTTGPQTPSPIWDPSWAAYDTYFKFGPSDLVINTGALAETNSGMTTGTLGLSSLFGPPVSGFGAVTSSSDTVKLLTPAKTGTNVNFLQVVIGGQSGASLSVEVFTNGISVPQQLTNFILPGSSATIGADANLGLRSPTTIEHQFQAYGVAPFTWDNLTPVTGNPASAPTPGPPA